MIDKNLLRVVRIELDRAMAEIGRKHDLLIKCGSGRFTDLSATLKVDIAWAEFGADLSKPMTSPKEAKYRAAWPRYADSLNMPIEWLDCEFTSHDSERYTIIGITPTRPKFPVATKRARDGAIVFHTPRGVITAMAVQKVAIKPKARGARK